MTKQYGTPADDWAGKAVETMLKRETSRANGNTRTA